MSERTYRNLPAWNNLEQLLALCSATLRATMHSVTNRQTDGRTDRRHNYNAVLHTGRLGGKFPHIHSEIPAAKNGEERYFYNEKIKHLLVAISSGALNVPY